MIPANEQNPILSHLRRCAEEGHVPTISEIEALASFRQAGGVTRLLEALQRVAVLHMIALRNRADA